MTMFLLAFTRWLPSRAASGRRARARCWVGALAGLAASAKYSGLIALATAGVVLGLRMLFGTAACGLRACAADRRACRRDRDRRRWKYVDNWRRHGTPLFANGSAGDAFSSTREYYWDRYDFSSFSITRDPRHAAARRRRRAS